MIGAGWFLGANRRRVANVVGSISDAVLVVLLGAAAGAAVWW